MKFNQLPPFPTEIKSKEQINLLFGLVFNRLSMNEEVINLYFYFIWYFIIYELIFVLFWFNLFVYKKKLLISDLNLINFCIKIKRRENKNAIKTNFEEFILFICSENINKDFRTEINWGESEIWWRDI